MTTSATRTLIEISRDLARKVGALSFSAPVRHVYNPLVYARAPHELYLARFGGKAPTILLGMNPGPFGMMQTGVPFGDITYVRDFLKIEDRVEKPATEHPKRAIEGFACRRKEVSGSRLFGFAEARFQTAEAFFKKFFVVNYCPLAFLTETGRNFTPDKLPAAEKAALFAVCDEALLRTAAAQKATAVIGIGAFAESRARTTFQNTDLKIGSILHPSPASPLANKGWAAQAEKQLIALDLL